MDEPTADQDAVPAATLQEASGGLDDDGTLHAQDPLPQKFSFDGPTDEYPRAPHVETGSVPKTDAYRRYPRISRPVELMRESYDVVVIGTGYGSSVAASRMARGRQNVCVLERGKERWPGEFPETFLDAIGEVRLSGEFAPSDRGGMPKTLVGSGNPSGLYHFALGKGQNVCMANGLGGTSLINANVYLEAAPAVLDMPMWPTELRGIEAWRKYYDRAGDVLEPVEYPTTFPELRKLRLFERQAALVGHEDKFYRVKQTTRFHDGPNSTGVSMRASTLSGMDATGINDGSKSTTLVNYLSDAWNWGAEMFCGCEVRYVTEAPGREGYIVHFAWYGGNRKQFPSFYDDLMWVHAKELVFFGAGSIGTTEILLRSKQVGLDISDEVGTEMSGNGDMIGFGYNTDYEANCVARRVSKNSPNPVGPCITSVLDMRDTENPFEGFVVEDASVPYALRFLLSPTFEALPDPTQPVYSFVRAAQKFASRVSGLILGPYFSQGSIAKTAIYLVMSHDSSQGRLILKSDQPVLTYSGVGRSASVRRIHEFLERLTAVVGGNFIANPLWTSLGSQEITVHPIGGARISPDGTGRGGVVNHIGELFIGSGEETHSGLVVCDGSMVPAALGVNPFATIAALAERSAELVAEKNGIAIDYATPNGILDLYKQPAYTVPRDAASDALAVKIAACAESKSAGISFSEIMTGFIHIGPDLGDFGAATQLARRQEESARVVLTIRSWDTLNLINSHLHQANITGTFTSASLGATFLVHRGTFQLFSQDPRQPETTNLLYSFDMVSPSGRKMHFDGYKAVNSGSFLNPLQIWRQTTTMYVTLTKDGKQVVGRGTMYLSVPDFFKEMQTLVADGPSTWSRIGSLLRFFTYFSKRLKDPFLSTLGRTQWPDDDVNASYRVTTPADVVSLVATDGVPTTMAVWNPLLGGKEVQEAAPQILFVPGAAVDHNIYCLPTIEKNAINFFREAGYRVYCITHRVGRTPVAKNGYTPFDVRLDILAALTYIRKAGNACSSGEARKIYVVAHCVGSLGLACGLLDGTIPGLWIRGVTSSAVFMNPRFGKMNHLMSLIPDCLSQILLRPWWDCTSSPNDTTIQRIANQVLRFYPVARARETCRSNVCHRSDLVYGHLWIHANINEETHRHLDLIMGGTTLDTIAWLAKAGHAEQVQTNAPDSTNLVTPNNLRRLAGIPMLFVAGSKNTVFLPENTDTTYTMLCSVHGKQWYQREIFNGRGHLDVWMGATSYIDVYPRVLQHVESMAKDEC
ncbi:Choline dehydrogenase or related flavoprotein [Geosmithia morbida]|uniref:Cholesterol oxidase n=1 Tax=Geosmithia morbida TaxID=1094350 RepID=A0A9P4YRF8_9HYPO|nr:Choline dehydrogenase or related flavoprotein [Geosmithia morbida]KAF4120343.1 Choline dehydrogenase or related flavoprotein [Geosmithia morbida]